MRRKVVITGIGVVAPIGIGKEAFWRNSLKGTSSIGPITRFDASAFSCRVAGEVFDFNAETYIDRKITKQTDRSTHMAMASCAMAMEDSGLQFKEGYTEQVGIYFANLFGGMEFAEPELYTCTFLNPRQVSAYQSIAWFYAATQGQWSISQGIHGYAKSIVADRAGGLQAIGWAMKAIQLEHCNFAFAGGFEAPLVPYAYLIHETSGLLVKANGEDEPVYRPYDARRNGFVLGEGAAIVLLEEHEHALARGAHIYSEVAGFAITRGKSNASNGTVDAKAVSSLAQCFRNALADAELSPANVGYYCGDGIANACADREEIEALKLSFGQEVDKLAVSTPKALTGHTLAAAGALDVVWTTFMLEHKIFLPVTNLVQPDPVSGIDYIVETPRAADFEVALCCNRGLGGLNTALVLKRYES